MISSILTKLFATLSMAYEKTQDEENLIQSTELKTCTMAQSRVTEQHFIHPVLWEWLHHYQAICHRFHSCILKLLLSSPQYFSLWLLLWKVEAMRNSEESKYIPSIPGTLYGILSVFYLAGRNVEGKRSSFTKQSFWMATDRNCMEADFLSYLGVQQQCS